MSNQVILAWNLAYRGTGSMRNNLAGVYRRPHSNLQLLVNAAGDVDIEEDDVRASQEQPCQAHLQQCVAAHIKEDRDKGAPSPRHSARMRIQAAPQRDSSTLFGHITKECRKQGIGAQP